MKFAAPSEDSGFPLHRAHGAHAQLATLLRVTSLCRSFRTAIDVGAHIGTWTTELEKRFSRVFAFEPQPDNFVCLEENVRGKAVLHQAALGRAPGSGAVFKHGDNSGCWSVGPGAGVEVRALDEFDFADVDLVKIDVEGREGDVLLGATETLRRSRPVVIFEDNGLGAKLFGAAWVDPAPVLRDLGYSPRMRIRKDEVWAA